jgi:hypothetical protein
VSGWFHAGEGGHLEDRANYSVTELEHMRESIREHLPISGAEWDLVAEHHERFHLDLEGTADQLKKKINKLASTKAPMGQLNIPVTVQEAKGIRVLNIEKAERATGSEEEGFTAEEGIFVGHDNGAGNPTEDACDALGVNDDNLVGILVMMESVIHFLCTEFNFVSTIFSHFLVYILIHYSQWTMP